MSSKPSKSIFLAPAPRIVSEIFEENDLTRLRAIAELVVHEDGDVTDAVFEEKAARAEMIIGRSTFPNRDCSGPLP